MFISDIEGFADCVWAIWVSLDVICSARLKTRQSSEKKRQQIMERSNIVIEITQAGGGAKKKLI